MYGKASQPLTHSDSTLVAFYPPQECPVYVSETLPSQGRDTNKQNKQKEKRAWLTRGVFVLHVTNS